MIGYAVVGSNDVEKAARFYEPLVEMLGAKRVHSFDRRIFYGVTNYELAVVTPHDGNIAAAGNGNMIALRAPSRQVVDAVHALALELGGSDEGGPVIRGREESGFYGTYFREPEGNKFCIFRIGPA
ncbi:MAG: VOC family protein [Rhodobiaceae bacterium]|nr:VOC family protein [Rhodobiaceae bacterium]